MPVLADPQGYPLTASRPETASLLDQAVTAYLGARTDARERLDRLLEADPSCLLGRALDGYLLMLASTGDSTREARMVGSQAIALAGQVGATRREALHLAALGFWAAGDLERAAAQWDRILDDHPRDILAIRVSQFVLSYLGESDRMRSTVSRVMPAWDRSVPGYGFVLGCEAYALEETGDYARAEERGQAAVSLDPSDIWAAHAVAHVREMEGRLREGIEWIASTSPHWGECNNFAAHLRWHEGLYLLELEDYEAVLDLYDRLVRPEFPDRYLDLVNSVSLLWRLEQAGVDVGRRWDALDPMARARSEDHALVFADLHYLMALAAVDLPAAEAFLASCERVAQGGQGTEAEIMREVGLASGRAIVAHRRGEYGAAVDVLYPVRERVRRIGGSHAQRDLFEQLLIDAAWRGRRLDQAASLLSERTVRRSANRWGWKHRALVLEALGRPESAAARRELDRLRSQR